MTAWAPALADSAPLEARARFERFVHWTLERELPRCASFLPEAERAALARSGGFLTGTAPLPEAFTLGHAGARRLARTLWHGAPGWMARWIAERADQFALRGMSPQLLDAGAGFGTYSMLFSSMGAGVVGADHGADHLDTAARRHEFHTRDTGVTLDLRYERADLTRPWSRRYDAVWVHDVLWHVQPMQQFFSEAHRRLSPGGVIVVSVVNGDHPANRGVVGSYPYAILRGLFEECGFRIVHHEVLWDRSPFLPGPLHESMVAPLQRRGWFGNRLARRQMLVAAVR